ncbi:hypothetical protein BH18ACT17_BH18ACT17_13330 [soil metagenome]
MQRILIMYAAAIIMTAASCSDSTTSIADPAGDPSAGSSGAAVSKVGSIDDLRSAFSEDDGAIRIVLSMSPT